MGRGNLFQKNSAAPLLVQGDIPDWALPAVKSILTSLKLVDPMTFHHCIRVGEHAKKLAKFAGLSEYQQIVAQFSGYLHDVGKMGVDQAIIHKPGKLDDIEYAKMKSHSVLSEELVMPLSHHDFFAQILPIVRGHHERVDGKGYPDKLHGENIPLLSRIILIVDTLDAMGQDRAYRKGMPIEAIYQELQKYSGTQFDDALVRIFLETHPKFWDEISEDHATVAEIKNTVDSRKAA